MSICDAEVPSDHNSPNWDDGSRVHEWKTYISNPLRDIWGTFTEVQRMVIAQNAQDIADNEEWD